MFLFCKYADMPPLQSLDLDDEEDEEEEGAAADGYDNEDDEYAMPDLFADGEEDLLQASSSMAKGSTAATAAGPSAGPAAGLAATAAGPAATAGLAAGVAATTAAMAAAAKAAAAKAGKQGNKSSSTFYSHDPAVFAQMDEGMIYSLGFKAAAGTGLVCLTTLDIQQYVSVKASPTAAAEIFQRVSKQMGYREEAVRFWHADLLNRSGVIRAAQVRHGACSANSGYVFSLATFEYRGTLSFTWHNHWLLTRMLCLILASFCCKVVARPCRNMAIMLWFWH